MTPNIPNIPNINTAGILAGRLHGDLGRIARCHLARERRDELEPGSLVGETFLRLANSPGLDDVTDAQFLAVASVCMVRVLIDKARLRRAAKRPQGHPVDVADVQLSVPPAVERTLPVREALGQLARRNPRCARVVYLRFCEDLSLEDVVDRTGLSLATVKRELRAGLEGLRALLQH